MDTSLMLCPFCSHFSLPKLDIQTKFRRWKKSEQKQEHEMNRNRALIFAAWEASSNDNHLSFSLTIKVTVEGLIENISASSLFLQRVLNISQSFFFCCSVKVILVIDRGFLLPDNELDISVFLRLFLIEGAVVFMVFEIKTKIVW